MIQHCEKCFWLVSDIGQKLCLTCYVDERIKKADKIRLDGLKAIKIKGKTKNVNSKQ
jgi:hypothetical protein